MKLTTITHVSVDGVMQGLGGSDEDRRGGFERGGWALPLFDNEAEMFLGEVFQRADAFLFGRLGNGAREASPPIAHATPSGRLRGSNIASTSLQRRPAITSS
jgi:hypothetical protein